MGKKPETFEGKSYPLELLGDKEFEEIVSELLNVLLPLKEKYNYTEAKYIDGGSDMGRDCVLYKGNEIVGIVQCKHSVNSNAMSKNIITDEILKMLLYLYIEPSLCPSEKKIYLFFISSKITNETLLYLKDFKEKEMKDREELSKKILRLKKKYKRIEEKLEKELNEEIFLKLEMIFDSMKKEYLTNMEIQTYLSSEETLVGLIKNKYFSIKKVVVNSSSEFPRIEQLDINYKKYNEERFYKKLEEIAVTDEILEQAFISYESKIRYTFELMKISSYYIREDLEEYNSSIRRKELNLREEKKIDLEIEDYDDDRLKKEYCRHYFKVLREIGECKFRNFDYIPPAFIEGTIQELVNVEKIKGWILLDKMEGKC